MQAVSLAARLGLAEGYAESVGEADAGGVSVAGAWVDVSLGVAVGLVLSVAVGDVVALAVGVLGVPVMAAATTPEEPPAAKLVRLRDPV
jgi:hypothetical protein